MKQQCNIAFIYGSWFITSWRVSLLSHPGKRPPGCTLVGFIALFLWLYVRYFPSVSRFMGYGSVADQEATNVRPSHSKVTFYTGLGCPFCPLVKRRLHELQSKMGFE